jgi:hypothetical protein
MTSRHKHAVIVAALTGSMGVAGVTSAQVPSAAPPATPNPSAAAPVQQTPTPPVAAPGATQNPSATPNRSPSASGSTTMQNPGLASSPIQMPSVLPNRAETAPSAFDKLATSGSTFVTKQETDRLDGFDRAFSEADRDRDGKLTKDEFNVAWAIYTGRT